MANPSLAYFLKTKKHGETLTVTLYGDVLLPDVASFNKAMREYSKLPDLSQLVLDLSQAGKMDASGLGVLVSLNTSMQRYGRRLVLLAPAEHVSKLLTACEIEGFFATCESEEELKGFFSGLTVKAHTA